MLQPYKNIYYCSQMFSEDILSFSVVATTDLYIMKGCTLVVTKMLDKTGNKSYLLKILNLP